MYTQYTINIDTMRSEFIMEYYAHAKKTKHTIITSFKPLMTSWRRCIYIIYIHWYALNAFKLQQKESDFQSYRKKIPSFIRGRHVKSIHCNTNVMASYSFSRSYICQSKRMVPIVCCLLGERKKRSEHTHIHIYIYSSSRHNDDVAQIQNITFVKVTLVAQHVCYFYIFLTLLHIVAVFQFQLRLLALALNLLAQRLCLHFNVRRYLVPSRSSIIIALK